VPPSRIVVKYLGVTTPAAPPLRAEQHEDLEILYLGRLIDCKRPDLVIKAFELACDKGLKGNLTIAGDGPLRDSCESLRVRSRYSERIQMLGAVDEQTAERLREKADVFTLHNMRGPMTRQEEALGVAAIEAMSSALPVVSARSGGISEVVVDGETGILVRPGDVDAHAEGFLKLASDPALRRRLGVAGWRRARTVFSLEKERSYLLRLLKIE
jgi:glycosyltransferase involved in cell wall biosynthesis